MIGAVKGIGYTVPYAQQTFRIPLVFASIVVIGALGFLTDVGFRRLRQYLLLGIENSWNSRTSRNDTGERSDSHVQGRSHYPQGPGNDPLRHGPLCARGAARRLERAGNRLDHGAGHAVAATPRPPRAISQGELSEGVLVEAAGIDFRPV